MPSELLRSLPSIDRLLERPLASHLSVGLSRDRVRDLLREITASFAKSSQTAFRSQD
jgi:hypothetical protein